MTIERADHARERGIALVYVGIFLVPLLLCTGLAVDLGRGYLVRATLAKAVDAAALAAARNITGDPSQAQAKSVAENIFNVNFPPGFLGVSPSRPAINFTMGPDGSHVVNVTSDATLPTTFMRVARFDSLTVAAGATAKRRLVDMSFVIDRSWSLKEAFPQVKEAAKQFVRNFDQNNDRIALITFSSGTTVTDRMQPLTRGFSLPSIESHIASADPGGPTATAEALYEAWDQLRTVTSDRSGLRIVVLFTDGSPNAFPGQFPHVATSSSNCSSSLTSTTARLTTALPGTICAIDYPNPLSKTYTVGLYDTYSFSGNPVSPTNVTISGSGFIFPWPPSGNPEAWNTCMPFLPFRSHHSQQFSSGIPSEFDLYDGTLPGQRPLIDATADGYRDHAQNAYNAARNLAEKIANEIRKEHDSGSSQIRIYTLGLGDLLTQNLGSPVPETGATILKRIANDPASPDYNPDGQLDGKYYYAGDPSQLGAAFQAVRDQIVRLTE